MEMSENTKKSIEEYYSTLSTKLSNRRNRTQEFEDTLLSKALSKREERRIRKAFYNEEAKRRQRESRRMSRSSFTILSILGKGAFGLVCLVEEKGSKELYAMKIMNKSRMIKKGLAIHAKTERNLMATIDNPWVVNLFCTFQDDIYLYMIMEFIQGGDLLTLLIKNSMLPEAEVRFYIAEIVMALDEIHKMGFIHRDLKPDNVLIDHSGHIKLTDFGLSKEPIGEDEIPKSISKLRSTSVMGKQKKQISSRKSRELRNRTVRQRRALAFSTVGTPDYIAVEVFRKKGYNQSVDFWSLGIIMFEMLFGYPPFTAESRKTTFRMISNWRRYFQFPNDVEISRECRHLITKLICEPQDRYNAKKIKRHPFFSEYIWDRNSNTPPYIPTITSRTDTRNFDDFSDVMPDIPESINNSSYDPEFEGYTFKRIKSRTPDEFVDEYLSRKRQRYT